MKERVSRVARATLGDRRKAMTRTFRAGTSPLAMLASLVPVGLLKEVQRTADLQRLDPKCTCHLSSGYHPHQRPGVIVSHSGGSQTGPPA